MSVQASSESRGPTTGQLVGGRFRIEKRLPADPLGTGFLAFDEKKKLSVVLRLLLPKFNQPHIIQSVKDACRDAAQLDHSAVLRTYGVGSLPQKRVFVSQEPPVAPSLRERLHRGDVMPVHEALMLAATLKSAMSSVTDAPSHGALRPSVIFQREDGSFRVGDFGIAGAIVGAVGVEACLEDERWFVAPELREGGIASRESDVYSLAATLRALVRGNSNDPSTDPRGDENLPEPLAWALEQAMATDPAERFEGVGEFVVALERVTPVPPVPSAPQPHARLATGEFEVDLDFDVAGEGHGDDPAAEPQRASVEVDLQMLLARIAENDAARWMMVKDQLDHGPFSGRELVEMILRGELLESDGLLNMDTGAREQASEFEEFSEFFAQYEITKSNKQRQQALVRAEKVEKVSNRAKILGGSALLGGVLIVSLVTFVTLRVGEDQAVRDVDARAELFERGEIEIIGTAESLPSRRRGRRGGRRGGQKVAAASTGGGPSSYEEAMNRAVDLGDVSQGGSERQLTGAEVATTMNRHVNQLYGCVVQELRGGSPLSSVQIDLAIAGSGQVLGASVRQGSGAFQRCVEGRVRSVRFPSFPAPRMGARYTFRVD